jgi:hypothetical protein
LAEFQGELWAKDEIDQIKAELDKGLTPWYVAKTLSAKLGRTRRAVDSKARKVARQMKAEAERGEAKA